MSNGIHTGKEWREMWRAFRKQNDDLMLHLKPADKNAIRPYVSHHSGGLLVVDKDVDSRVPGEVFTVKMHDTWGDPVEGDIVVHLYDPAAEDVQAHDVVLPFDVGCGSQAVALFVNDEALAAIWEATR
jgi:hypothetical protein